VTGPLEGRTVVVTRPLDDAQELAGRLRSEGAEVLVAPVIRLEPGDTGELAEATREAANGRFDWVVFTSAAGVRAWFERADGRPRSRVAAVGGGTAEALRSEGVEPDLVPETFTTEALGQTFPEGSGQVLLPRADIAPPGLRDALAAKGWRPVPVVAYRTRFEEELPDGVAELLAGGRVDAVTFTSASTVEGFVRLAGIPEGVPAVCIGPVTADTARRAGFEVTAVAEPHTIEGLVQAVIRALRR
jgi:uroporphyrinogen III methyltransferase/synthase